MSKSLEEILKDIKYDEDSCLITLDGVEIGQWNDEAHCDYPEDLIWRRDISNFHHKAFKAGFDAAIKAVSERENKLADAISVIRGIVIQIDKANGNGLYQRYSKGPINMAKKSAKEFLESTNEEALKEHGG